jgi:hypothetical protein
MNICQLKEYIESGRHIRQDAPVRLPSKDKVNVYVYIDLIKYGVIHEAENWLDPDFLTNFKALPTDDKVELAENDEYSILPAVMLAELYRLDYQTCVNNPNQMIKDMLLAIAIVDKKLDLIDKDDNWALYRYFVNSHLEPVNLYTFADPQFVSFMLENLLVEKRVIFTWIIENLISMIQASLLSPMAHENFFVELFKENKYIQGKLADLFREAVRKHPRLFDLLTKCNLCIDPFSKQVNYSQWLQDSKKFLYLGQLRTTMSEAATACVAAFDRRMMLYQNMNRYSRIFEMPS